jgi:hypothetical protein
MLPSIVMRINMVYFEQIAFGVVTSTSISVPSVKYVVIDDSQLYSTQCPTKQYNLKISDTSLKTINDLNVPKRPLYIISQ